MSIGSIVSTYSKLVQDRTGVCNIPQLYPEPTYRMFPIEGPGTGANVTSNDDDDRELELGGFPDKGDI